MDKIITALIAAYNAIDSQHEGTFGFRWIEDPDEAYLYPIREELKDNIEEAIEQAKAIKAHRIKMFTAGY